MPKVLVIAVGRNIAAAWAVDHAQAAECAAFKP
jgi:hypothetical protein